jgi:hypothetical protein
MAFVSKRERGHDPALLTATAGVGTVRSARQVDFKQLYSVKQPLI